MPDVGVVHMDLMAKGGGESVCMNVLEALQEDHEVTLITLTDPDFDELNEYFRTEVREPRIEFATPFATALHSRCGLDYYVLQNALLSRYARRRADDFDLLVSTINELGLGANAVEYVHFPFDWTVSLDDDLREQIFHPTVEEDGVYERLCTGVAGIGRDAVAATRLLANSPWTADVVEEAYGTPPEVVYPPVDTAEFEDRPWEERENGFVTVGRIERSKRIHELVEIVGAVRERGHDVHLHVVGPTVDSTYCEEIEALAADRPWLSIDGELPRSELVERVCSHRYGIHGKRHEHFGMAVAELAAAGSVPFAPATGGQSVILDDREELLYRSVDDAAAKIDRVLSRPSLRRELRPDPERIRRRFGRQRFHERFAEIARDAIAAGDARVDEAPADDATGSLQSPTD